MIVDAHVHLWDAAHTPQPWMTSEHAAIARPVRPERSPPAARTQRHRRRRPRPGRVPRLGHGLPALGGRRDTTGSQRSPRGWRSTTRSGRARDSTSSGRTRRSVPCGISSTTRPTRTGSCGPRCSRASPCSRSATSSSSCRSSSLVTSTTSPFSPSASRSCGSSSTTSASRRSERDEMATWERDLRAAAAFPNVLAKLSGLNTATRRDPTGASTIFCPRARAALDAFGPNRLMCGSDWPVALLNGDYDRVWDCDASGRRGDRGRDADALLGENAARVYRFTDAPARRRRHQERAHGNTADRPGDREDQGADHLRRVHARLEAAARAGPGEAARPLA